MSNQCPRCGEELEKNENSYNCSSLAGCGYSKKKETNQIPIQPMELNVNKYKALQLLKEQYPHGHAGYKMEFRVAEFFEKNVRGERKFLHVHVVVKKGNRELLEVRVPKIPLIIEYENYHEKESIRNKWKRIIRNNMESIMIEIKTKLTQFGISLDEWGIENY